MINPVAEMASQTSLVSAISQMSELNEALQQPEEEKKLLTRWEEKQNKLKITRLKEENRDLTVDISFTIGITGPDGVGKRSLAAKVCEDTALRKRPNQRPKVISFKSKIYQLDGLDILVHMWLAPGDESYRSKSARFLSKTAGNIIMYDVGNPESLFAARGWIQELEKRDANKTAGPDGKIRKVPTILVGNKIDLPPQSRKVPYSAGSDLAYAHGIDYYESTCVEEIQDETIKQEMAELEILENKAAITAVDPNSDKVDERGDPDLVVINLIRKILRQLPRKPVDMTYLPEDCNSDSLSLLAVPAQVYYETNIRLHRPLYMSLPMGFVDLQLDETVDEITIKIDDKAAAQHKPTVVVPDLPLDLQEELLGDYLIGTDDDKMEINTTLDFEKLDVEQLKKKRETATQRIRPFEARIQYNTCLERMNVLHTVASEKLDWM